MKQITQIGATTQEAISLALQKLGKTLEQVDVKVLQEAKKGFFGFGARQAKVIVTVIETEEQFDHDLHEIQQIDQIKVSSYGMETLHIEEQVDNAHSLEVVKDSGNEMHQPIDPIEETKAYIQSIARGMGITDLEMELKKEGKYIILHLSSEKAALLIGKRGHTLNALQQLAQLVFNKYARSFAMLKLDVENYRERRKEALEILAQRMADKAIRTHQKVQFEPMPSGERKIIHGVLSNRVDIETYSEGVEPNRYLVIVPIK